MKCDIIELNCQGTMMFQQKTMMIYHCIIVYKKLGNTLDLYNYSQRGALKHTTSLAKYNQIWCRSFEKSRELSRFTVFQEK